MAAIKSMKNHDFKYFSEIVFLSSVHFPLAVMVERKWMKISAMKEAVTIISATFRKRGGSYRITRRNGISIEQYVAARAIHKSQKYRNLLFPFIIEMPFSSVFT